MKIKEFLSVLDTECVDSVCIIKDNEILWSDTELTTIPQNFFNCAVKLVSPQHNTEYYEDYNGEMCEGRFVYVTSKIYFNHSAWENQICCQLDNYTDLEGDIATLIDSTIKLSTL